MKIERFVYKISTYGTWAVVLLTMAFPVWVVLARICGAVPWRGEPIRGFGFAKYLWLLGMGSDCGLSSSLTWGAVSLVIWLAAILWLAWPRLRFRPVERLGLGLALLLFLLAVSAELSCTPYESLLFTDACAACTALMLLVANGSLELIWLRRNENGRDNCEVSRDGAQRGRSAELVAKWLMFLGQAVLAAVILGRWYLYFTCAEGGVVDVELFGHGGVWTSFLLMGLPLAARRLIWLIEQGRSSVQNGVSTVNWKLSVAVQGIFLLIILLSLTFTYSWVAWGCLFLGCVVALAVSKLSRRIWAAALVVVLALFCLAAWLGSGSLLDSKDQTEGARGAVAASVGSVCLDGTEGTAWQSCKLAWRMFKEHPLMGVGLGNFSRYAPQYQDDFHSYVLEASSLTFSLLAQVGLVACLLFYGLIIFASVLAWRHLQSDSGELRVWRLGMLAGFWLMILQAQFENNFSTMGVGLAGALLIGLAVGFPNERDLADIQVRCTDEHSDEDRLPLLVNVILVGGCVLSFGLLGQAAGGQFYDVLAQFFERAGKINEARQCYNWATEYDPKVGRYWHKMAVLTLKGCDNEVQAGQVAVGMLFCSMQASILDPHEASIRYTLGLAAELSGRLELAEGSYQMAMRLDAKNRPEFYSGLARVQFKLGHREAALKVLEQAISQFNSQELVEYGDSAPKRIADIRRGLAECYVLCFDLAGEETNARAYLLQACLLDNGRTQQLKQLIDRALLESDVLMKAERTEKSREVLQQAQVLNSVLCQVAPKDPRGTQNRINIENKLVELDGK